MKYLQTFSRGFFGLTVSEHTKPLAKPLFRDFGVWVPEGWIRFTLKGGHLNCIDAVLNERRLQVGPIQRIEEYFESDVPEEVYLAGCTGEEWISGGETLWHSPDVDLSVADLLDVGRYRLFHSYAQIVGLQVFPHSFPPSPDQVSHSPQT